MTTNRAFALALLALVTAAPMAQGQTREEMVRDIKMVGKELAIDIVALNKKIDTRTHTQVERMRQWEAVIKKCEQRVHKLMKQYNTVS